MIRYTFILDEESTVVFDVDTSGDTSVETPGEAVPAWARLDSHRCDMCPLPEDSRVSCPAAQAIRPAIEAFSASISFENVRVRVEIRGLEMETSMPAQNAVRSLMGLQLALSACPVMNKLRPMAEFHVPFGTKEHTTFRFLGTYLIAQFLRAREGKAPDWSLDGLGELFSRIHQVNIKLAKRIRAASEEDATVNSLVFLDNYAHIAEMRIEKSAAELLPLFGMYLDG